jgi:hypothetical protein
MSRAVFSLERPAFVPWTLHRDKRPGNHCDRDLPSQMGPEHLCGGLSRCRKLVAKAAPEATYGRELCSREVVLRQKKGRPVMRLAALVFIALAGTYGVNQICLAAEFPCASVVWIDQ